MKGIVIKQHWINLILSGQKDWEIRGRNAKIRGTIALIQSGSGMVFGTVDLVDSIPLTKETFNATQEHHKIPVNGDTELPYKKTHAWVFKNPVIFPKPIPCSHPLGAVIWINIKEDIEVKEDDIRDWFKISTSSELLNPGDVSFNKLLSLYKSALMRYYNIHTSTNIMNFFEQVKKSKMPRSAELCMEWMLEKGFSHLENIKSKLPILKEDIPYIDYDSWSLKEELKYADSPYADDLYSELIDILINLATVTLDRESRN
ncbi:ASCH domain-containing protein [Bacillus sp. NPDC094106]|uniref:ASCH domain-containing protein n=1 Tax=Bacillus sp. NPDC094106 TaxID=3363949 RepID=UPI0037F78185